MSIKITLSHPWQGHAVNETIELDDDRARQLVQAGAARYYQAPTYPSADTFPTGDTAPSSPEQGAVDDAAQALAAAQQKARSQSVQGDSAAKPASGPVVKP